MTRQLFTAEELWVSAGFRLDLNWHVVPWSDELCRSGFCRQLLFWRAKGISANCPGLWALELSWSKCLPSKQEIQDSNPSSAMLVFPWLIHSEFWNISSHVFESGFLLCWRKYHHFESNILVNLDTSELLTYLLLAYSWQDNWLLLACEDVD